MILARRDSWIKKYICLANNYNIRYPLTSYYIRDDNHNIPILPHSADVLVLRTYRAGGKHQWC
ncbi:hypothetical protein [Prevotella melaninogenica]|uniref:hypothetical protein n=1 Tax=Prevotella melaninogenica TaxID=28132 RepID=UPI001BA7116A|nr:hypothetical protein [Prevotella melaninogenica]QUB65933.1 hypothetical protein J5A57_02185 [Prevotella melaninogenica]